MLNIRGAVRLYRAAPEWTAGLAGYGVVSRCKDIGIGFPVTKAMNA